MDVKVIKPLASHEKMFTQLSIYTFRDLDAVFQQMSLFALLKQTADSGDNFEVTARDRASVTLLRKNLAPFIYVMK